MNNSNQSPYCISQPVGFILSRPPPNKAYSLPNSHGLSMSCHHPSSLSVSPSCSNLYDNCWADYPFLLAARNKLQFAKLVIMINCCPVCKAHQKCIRCKSHYWPDVSVWNVLPQWYIHFPHVTLQIKKHKPKKEASFRHDLDPHFAIYIPKYAK